MLTRRAEVGRRLREFRREGGLTQAELSRAVRIGQASLSNYENGKRELPLVVAVNLAGALGVSLGDLLEIPGILVVRDASMGRAVRTLAASPRLLDSVVPPVEPEPDEDDTDEDEPDDGSGDDEGDTDDDTGEDEDSGTDDDGADDDGNSGADDRGDAEEDDGRDADETS